MPVYTPPLERILAQIELTDSGCWIFAGHLTKGYGSISIRNKFFYVHRVAYEGWRGPIPPGLSLDHLCRVTACCNPDHLEPVTHKENMLRSEAPTVKQLRLGVCRRGHDYSGDNIYIRPKSGQGMCKPCMRMRTAGLHKKAA